MQSKILKKNERQWKVSLYDGNIIKMVYPLAETKQEALAKFLNIDIQEIEEAQDEYFDTPESEYLVLTDEEADEATKNYIADSLWAFNISFLKQFLNENLYDEAETRLKPLQEKCESGNETIKVLVNWDKQADDIVSEAIAWDGRGHFLSSYDGEENEEGEYFIYRTN